MQCLVNKGLTFKKKNYKCIFAFYQVLPSAVRMVMSEQGGLAMHQLPIHHRGLVQPSLVMNPHPINDSCSMDSQNSKFFSF